MNKIKLGISSCLLGEKVRYDGGHKLDYFLANELGKYVEFVKVCPEVEIGLQVPREAMRLVGNPGPPRLVTQKTGIDYTNRMLTWAKECLDRLETEELCGFIFKAKSPSSGMERVKVYNESGGGVPQRNGVGIFARAFMERFPLIPVEDEGRLNDIEIRENFIIRVFTLHRWSEVKHRPHSTREVVDFHSANKLLFFAHHIEIAREMGRLTAHAAEMEIEDFYKTYETSMMKCLSYKSTLSKNSNVLYHMMGYFKKQLNPDEKQELIELIENYRLGFYPLAVPVTLIAHYVKKYRQQYLKDQYYLNPHPIELKLRNHA